MNARRCYRRSTHTFRNRLALGYTGLVALLDEEIVGYVWGVDSRHADHPEVVRHQIPLGAGDVYAFDMFLAEEHRGHGNSAAFLDQVHAALVELGHRAMWGYIESDNVPSRWLFTTCGHSVVRRTRSRQLLSRLLIVDRRLYLQRAGGLRALVAW